MPPKCPNASAHGYGNQHVHAERLAQNEQNQRAFTRLAQDKGGELDALRLYLNVLCN